MAENLPSPLFSVVIPAYNRAKIISRAIDSVLAQTFTDFEIIVVDDGSTDDLKKVCDAYNSSKIHYYYQENAGSNPARNTGIKRSQGYYVSFLDSDDTWKPEYLNEVAQKFASDNELGLVYVKNVKKILPQGTEIFKKSRNWEGFVYRDVLQHGRLTTSSCLSVKRSLLETIGGWDNNLYACQDDDICFRLVKVAKVGCVDKVLSTIYIDEQLDRISSSSLRRTQNTLFIWRKFSDDVISNCGKKEFEKKIAGVYSAFLELDDKNGLSDCEQILVKYLGYSNHKLFVFRIKCKNKAIAFQIKRSIKKIMRNKK